MRQAQRPPHPGPGRGVTDDRSAESGPGEYRSRWPRRQNPHGQEQYGRGRELVRLARELPHPPQPRFQPSHHGAVAVASCPGSCWWGPGPSFPHSPRSNPMSEANQSEMMFGLFGTFGCDVGGTVLGHNPITPDHQRPGRAPCRTRRSTAGCTSSSVTPRCRQPPRRSRSGPPCSCSTSSNREHGSPNTGLHPVRDIRLVARDLTGSSQTRTHRRDDDHPAESARRLSRPCSSHRRQRRPQPRRRWHGRIRHRPVDQNA